MKIRHVFLSFLGALALFTLSFIAPFASVAHAITPTLSLVNVNSASGQVVVYGDSNSSVELHYGASAARAPPQQHLPVFRLAKITSRSMLAQVKVFQFPATVAIPFLTIQTRASLLRASVARRSISTPPHSVAQTSLSARAMASAVCSMSLRSTT